MKNNNLAIAMDDLGKPLKLSTAQLIMLIMISWLLQIFIDQGIAHNILGRRDWSALLDPFAHMILASMVLIPWLVFWQLPRLYLLIGVSFAVLIDTDHIWAARSWAVTEMIKLSERPIVHSLMIITIISIFMGIVTKNKWIAQSILIALLSHISRDATSGKTPWLWPFVTESPVLPMWLHILIWSGFALIFIGLQSRRNILLSE
jgi:hypothetical protein